LVPICSGFRHNPDISCPEPRLEVLQSHVNHGFARSVTEISLAVVAGTFDARPGAEAALGAVLARYVVMSRTSPGCRNIDLVASLTTPGRFLVYEKWETPEHQREHLTSAVTETMAAAALPLLAGPPELGLFEAISAHDLI
jgi:quinol monooxygenase YgiN